MALVPLLLLVCLTAGCCCKLGAAGSIPVCAVPLEYLAESRGAKEPINFTLLGQTPPDGYRVGPGDTLGIYVKGVLDSQESPYPIDFPPNVLDPNLTSPVVGVPILVDRAGGIRLPLLPPLDVTNLTIPEVAELLETEYVTKRQIIQQEVSRIVVTLVRPRVARIVVLREDSPVISPLFRTQNDYEILSKRGSAQVIELPAYENDVLHALSASGGLPGADARSEIIVLRGGSVLSTGDVESVLSRIERQPDAAPGAASHGEVTQVGYTEEIAQESIPPGEAGAVHYDWMNGFETLRIPLRLCFDEPLPFGPQDVVLQTGDVVYVPSRETDHFYTGGLLRGAKIPLPRHEDLDILSAISVAHGFVGGPDKLAGATNFRGPGNVIPPTLAIIVRRTPDGGQIKIRVDLKRAMMDPSERIVIMPGDLVMLHYRPLELLGNVGLNIVGINYSIPSD